MAEDFLAKVRAAAAAALGKMDANDLDSKEVEARGETLLTISRRGKHEQLRVVADEFNGKRFATLRVWFRDPEDGDHYLPTKRGVTVRRSELPQVLAALHTIAERLDVEAAGETS